MKKKWIAGIVATSLLAPAALQAQPVLVAKKAKNVLHETTEKLKETSHKVTKKIDETLGTANTKTVEVTTKHVRKSQRFEGMKAAAHIRANQEQAWDNYVSAYREFRALPQETKGLDNKQFVYGEKSALNVLARQDEARKLKEAISSLRSTLSTQQINALNNFAAHYKPRHRKNK